VPGSSYLPADLAVPAGDDGPTAPYWAALREHRLTAQQCASCGTLQNPAEYLCHACHGTDLPWVELPATGRVYAWTRIWHPVHPALVDRVPYLVAWVELDHPGLPRFLGNLLGDPRQEVRAGDPVSGVFEDREDGTVLQWVRAEPPASRTTP
jgi:uncharacterized OB-fold protein